jgi:hypothetical protein
MGDLGRDLPDRRRQFLRRGRHGLGVEKRLGSGGRDGARVFPDPLGGGRHADGVARHAVGVDRDLFHGGPRFLLDRFRHRAERRGPALLLGFGVGLQQQFQVQPR